MFVVLQSQSKQKKIESFNAVQPETYKTLTIYTVILSSYYLCETDNFVKNKDLKGLAGDPIQPSWTCSFFNGCNVICILPVPLTI